MDEIIYPTVEQPGRVSRSPGLSRDGLRVLVHGRMDLVKNVETVMRGFAHFSRGHCGRHELHLVGAGPDLVRLQGVAQELGIMHAVRIHGFLDSTSLTAPYAQCDVMAALPIDEPFGMVFPEAALRGLLLVGPDTRSRRSCRDPRGGRARLDGRCVRSGIGGSGLR